MGYKIDETKLVYALAGLVFVCALCLLGWFIFQYLNIQYPISNIQNDNQDEIVLKKKSCEFYRLLDGICVDSQNKINPHLVAIMIENHPAARPQSGLADASVVYEAPVEANYTRFMAIYSADADVSEVGPVRSARPYYLDWLAEYGRAMYMHCGGSPEALQKIEKENIPNVNEMFNSWYYWRDENRLAPHNLYTSSELWNKANKLQVTSYKLQDGWIFSTSTEQQDNITILVDDIEINFLAPDYVVDWKYNSSTQKYERWQAGMEHRDRDGALIEADTIAVQHVKYRVLDAVGRISIDTIGTGSAEVYFDGQSVSGTWKKESQSSRTRFYNSSGEEILFKPGKIWIEVVNR